MFEPRAPNYLVTLRDDVNAYDEVARFEALYGFSATAVWTAIGNGFAAEFDADVREMLRCEPTVAYVAYDAILHI